MKDNRNITLKTNVTVDDYLLIASLAKAARKSMSTHIRDCCLPKPNVKPPRPPVARPSLARFQAKFAPGRIARPELRLRH